MQVRETSNQRFSKPSQKWGGFCVCGFSTLVIASVFQTVPDGFDPHSPLQFAKPVRGIVTLAACGTRRIIHAVSIPANLKSFVAAFPSIRMDAPLALICRVGNGSPCKFISAMDNAMPTIERFDSEGRETLPEHRAAMNAPMRSARVAVDDVEADDYQALVGLVQVQAADGVIA